MECIPIHETRLACCLRRLLWGRPSAAKRKQLTTPIIYYRSCCVYVPFLHFHLANRTWYPTFLTIGKPLLAHSRPYSSKFDQLTFYTLGLIAFTGSDLCIFENYLRAIRTSHRLFQLVNFCFIFLMSYIFYISPRSSKPLIKLWVLRDPVPVFTTSILQILHLVLWLC